jgi:hypothetical protein
MPIILLQKAERHIRIRYLGYFLFLSGILLFGFAMWNVSHTRIWFNLILGFASVGTGLSVFGVNHDTAIALAVQVDNNNLSHEMSQVLSSEYKEDLDWDRPGTLALQPHIKSAYFIMILSLAIQVFLLNRLFPIV